MNTRQVQHCMWWWKILSISGSKERHVNVEKLLSLGCKIQDMLPGNSTDSNLKIWLLVRPTAGQRGTHRLLSCALFFSPVTSRVHDARSSRQPLLLSPDHRLGHSLHAQLSTTQHSPHPQPLGFSHFQDVSPTLWSKTVNIRRMKHVIAKENQRALTLQTGPLGRQRGY